MINLARILVLFVSLLGAGLVPHPAFAQSPTPVPALPDQERRTAYNITGSTCVCAVNFAIYGDSTDVDAWIQVWVNGTRRLSTDLTFGWSLSSSSGALGSIARPITNAILTFKSPQTGVIQIVGARRPRRLSQFSENQGVAARDLNQVITDMVAQQRESWDKTNDITGRGIFSQPGNAMGPLPLPTACVNGFLQFGANGLTPTCAQFPASGQSTPQYQIFPAPGAVTTLTLTNTPLPSTALLVVINFDGVTQARTTWSINVTTGVITFGTPIPASVQIVEVDWFAPAAVIIVNPPVATNTVTPFANIAALRANTAPVTNAYVSGYVLSSDGGEGPLNYVATDTTTADNNCTIFVDAVGHRWYRSFINNISVKWCGAKGDGSTDDTIAIQSAINYAKTYGAGLPSAGGLCVTFPVGSYIISSLNATNWVSGCMQGPGGSQAVSIYAANQVSSAPILDLTSSPGFFIQQLNFYAMTIGGVAPPVLPSVGVLMAPTIGLSDTDLIRFNFVQFTGFYTTSACYIYSVTDIRFDSVNCVNQNLSVGYGMVMGNINIFGITSPYTTTGTGTGVCADITWYGGTAGLGSFATSSAGLLMSGCQGIRFRDGVFAAGGSSFYIEMQGANQAIAFENIQLNQAVVTKPLDVFFLSATAITGMNIINIQAGGQYSSLLIGGSSSTCTGCVILGMDPASITGGQSSLFSHLP